ncbi:hypothetical protein EON65_11490 [archaeon]|nr:MAG: hypothetical protein EON65_11490 [archaeon]
MDSVLHIYLSYSCLDLILFALSFCYTGEGDPQKILQKVLKTKSSVQRWKETKVLVIDEISMLDKRLFELLDTIARTVRNTDLPFGGIQLIAVGDFLQLPPVRKTGNREFCFESPVWEAAGLHLRNGYVYLRTAERQNDENFVAFLNEVRLGILSDQFFKNLNACLVNRKAKPANGIIPTKLYAVNKQVDEENNMRLAELPGEVITMVALDMWKIKPTKATDSQILREGVENLIPESIDLKLGAQVMLLRNRSRMTYGGIVKTSSTSLVNGSRGRIVAFTESVQRPGMLIPTVLFDNGMKTIIGPVEYEYKIPKVEGSIVRIQVPLKLAW